MNCRKVTTWVLKTWPEPFEAVRSGRKTAEWRRDDRGGYHAGDLLHLVEWDPDTSAVTGRQVLVEVTYVQRGAERHPFDLPAGFVVLSIRKIA